MALRDTRRVKKRARVEPDEETTEEEEEVEVEGNDESDYQP